MSGRRYAFFQNRECEFFPCHADIAEEDFNCLFCYCPFYMEGSGCPGEPRFLENGVKSCEGCAFPHRRDNYDTVTVLLSEKIKTGLADPGNGPEPQ